MDTSGIFGAAGAISGARGRAAALAMAAAVAWGAGCQRDPEFDGIDRYSLQELTLADAPGVCTPDDELTWCHTNPSVAIGDQAAAVDLYFRGDGDRAPLVEIVLTIRGCRGDDIARELTGELGDPDGERGSTLRWEGEYAVLFAQLDTGGAGCEINFVDPEDDERIGELRRASAEAAGDIE